MKKIRIGFCGLGDHMMKSHVESLLKNPDVLLVGAFDPNPDSVYFKTIRNELGVSDFKHFSYEDLWKNTDAVMIGSPDRFHAAQLLDAVTNGKHVLCEKPLCASPAELETVEKALELGQKKNLIVTSCHPRRFDPPYV
ncbi:MAG: Gfo/Idh/MocA family oxidoreductase, partial [Lactobacillales bacterium]|nr:Gfo/Idh/MocA family oxidoreductase [Lactobacillales bacterium]